MYLVTMIRHHDPADLYLTPDGEDVKELVLEQADSCLMLPDGRLLLIERYDGEELIGPQGAAKGRTWPYDAIQWPTIRDPQTGEQWPIRLPSEVFNPGYEIRILAIQQGPFLRVVDVDDCLPIRAEPSPDAGELACMAERVLLTDLGETTELEDATWHKARTPAGLEGWAEVATWTSFRGGAGQLYTI